VLTVTGGNTCPRRCQSVGEVPTAPAPSLSPSGFLGVVILHALWMRVRAIIRIVVALLSFGALMLTLITARRAENRRYAAQA
jgi:hypothetical protein